MSGRSSNIARIESQANFSVQHQKIREGIKDIYVSRAEFCTALPENDCLAELVTILEDAHHEKYLPIPFTKEDAEDGRRNQREFKGR